MTNAELLQEGLTLMLVGISFVMFFLFILILAISFMSKIVNRYFPEPIAQPANSPSISTEDNDLERLRPAIIAAVVHHRRLQGLK